MTLTAISLAQIFGSADVSVGDAEVLTSRVNSGGVLPAWRVAIFCFGKPRPVRESHLGGMEESEAAPRLPGTCRRCAIAHPSTLASKLAFFAPNASLLAFAVFHAASTYGNRLLVAVKAFDGRYRLSCCACPRLPALLVSDGVVLFVALIHLLGFITKTTVSDFCSIRRSSFRGKVVRSRRVCGVSCHRCAALRASSYFCSVVV